MTADTGDGKTPAASSLSIWMSTCPTSIGWACAISACRSGELSHNVAASTPAKRWRMTQSICAGGFGGITVCSMKPVNCDVAAPICCCHLANSSSRPARTRVCVTMVTAPDVGWGWLISTAASRECADARMAGGLRALPVTAYWPPSGASVCARATGGGLHLPVSACDFGAYIRIVRLNGPLGAGSQLVSLSAPGVSFWK
jgi:hypothetical protein